jgi:hypothetical protein
VRKLEAEVLTAETKAQTTRDELRA